MKGQSRENQFYIYVDNAEKQYKKGKWVEAIKCYHQAITRYQENSQSTDLDDYLAVHSQIFKIYRENNRTQDAYKIITQAIEEERLRSSEKQKSGWTNFKMKKQKLSLQSNLALILDDLICEKKDNINTFKECIANYKIIFDSYKKSRVIILEVLRDENSEELFWWSKQYIQLYVNICSALLDLFQITAHEAILTEMLKHINTCERFYNSSKHKKILEERIMQIYYYKGICYVHQQNFKEAQKIYLKVFKFEEQKALTNNLKKTRAQLCNLYTLTNQYDQMKGLFQEDQIIKFKIAKELKEKKQSRERIKKVNVKTRQQKLKLSYQQYEQFFDNFENGSRDKFAYDDAEMVAFILENVDIYQNHTKIQSLFYYQASQCSIQLKKYKEALLYINKALNLASNQYELIECKKQKIQIQQKMGSHDQSTIKKSYEQLLKECKNYKNEDQKAQFNQIRKSLQRYQILMSYKREINYRLPETEGQLKILSNYEKQYKRFCQKKHSDRQINIIDDYSEDQADQKLNSLHQIKNKYPNSSAQYVIIPINVNKKNLLQFYQEKCKQNQCPIRVEIKQYLSSQKNNANGNKINPFEQLINLEQKQLKLLLEIFECQTQWSFKNHYLSEKMIEYLEELSQKRSAFIKKVQLNNICGSVKHLRLCQILMNLKALSEIQLINFAKLNKSQKRTHSNNDNSLPPHDELEDIFDIFHKIVEQNSNVISLEINQFKIQNLLSLKLKYCNMEDKDLEFMGIDKFTSLKSINLSNNHLTGSTIYLVLFNLLKLNNINFSNNPLTCLPCQKNQQRMDIQYPPQVENPFQAFPSIKRHDKVQRFSLCGIKFNENNIILLEQVYTFLLQFDVEIIDLSGCSNLSLLFHHIIANIINHEQFNTFAKCCEKMLLKSLKLCPALLEDISNMAYYLKALKQIDLRFLKGKEGSEEDFQRILNADHLRNIRIKSYLASGERMIEEKVQVKMEAELLISQ